MTNKNYKQANYAVEIDLAKTPNEVFHHIIDLSKWWPEEYVGESIKINTEFVLRSGETHYSKNKVIEFVPNEKIIWLTIESIRKTDNYDWSGTKFIFELTPKGENTVLKFTYDGPVLENEYDRLVQICDMTIKEMFCNFINHAKKHFTATIEVTKSPEDVFKAITDDVAKWWGGNDLEGNSTKLNDEFIIHHPGAHYSVQQLVEIIPNKRIVWLVKEGCLHWLKKDPHEWTHTKMIFEITAKSDNTILHFTHEGLVPEKECYEMCASGWTMVIKDWLFNFITEGKPHFLLT